MSEIEATRRALPLVLIRGFGGVGVEDERRIAYQGFNDGTVYPHKRGENYIYEGLILRFMKSDWQYRDATNVVGSCPDGRGGGRPSNRVMPLRSPLFFWRPHRDRCRDGPGASLKSAGDPSRTLWVFRYYDLDDRRFDTYGKALVRLIGFIRDLASGGDRDRPQPKVNILAHSMGGLLVREAVQVTYPAQNQAASNYINKIVTLGTPHQGISFQLLREWIKVDAEQELERFNPAFQRDEQQTGRKNKQKHKRNDAAFIYFKEYFPLDRLLAVVGTNYQTSSVSASSWMNRAVSLAGEGGPAYNRSDGLVKQTYAQIPGAHRTFVHKCHGGHDSLVTSREAYEIATRFFFGNLRARLRLVSAKIERGGDWFGKSEYFFGVTIKPRQVDFELFHQSSEAENCYGPFSREDLTDRGVDFDWADPETRLIWEGCLDTSKLAPDRDRGGIVDMVLRIDVYVGERDVYGVGFSDNVIFRKQYYLRAVLDDTVMLFRHTGEQFMQKHDERGPYIPRDEDRMEVTEKGWEFAIGGTGFSARLGLELDYVPEDGAGIPLRDRVAEGGRSSVVGHSAMPKPSSETSTPGA